MNTHLFDKIAVTVAIAMEHKGVDSRHNGRVVEKVTKDIMEAVKEELPDLVDLDGKWELTGDDGVHVTITGEEKYDHKQLVYLSKFAADQGHNAVILKLQEDLTVPLKKPSKTVIVE